MLNIRKVKLELIADPDMYIFFEKELIGGASDIANRYTKANNKCLKSYDPKQEPKHITYLNAKKLYGYAMSKLLLKSGYKWIDSKEFNLNKNASNSLKGCVLEYHIELREKHNYYPLAPDKIEIKRQMLSEYQINITDLYNIPIDNAKRLVPNFFDKKIM